MEFKNEYKIIEIDGKYYVEFVTNGKYQVNVIVDIEPWNNYLGQLNWTVCKQGKRMEVKTSIGGSSIALHRYIVRKEFTELETYNRTVDHKNNNNLDNRIENFKLSNARLNGLNKASDKNYIYAPKGYGKKYKVQMNIDEKMYFAHFSTIEECEKYRDEVLMPIKEREIRLMEKKDRDIEFERGLVNKIQNGELDEIMAVLKKYNI